VPRSIEDWKPLELLGFMTAMGMSRQQMADVIGVRNVSTVSRWLNGHTVPTKQRLAQLNALIAARELLLQQVRIERNRGK
jgi:transcriptional regulator with XRE-family HTH domain